MKRAIIIGASSGIGQRVSYLLLKSGWRLGLCSRREDRLKEIKALNPEMVEVLALDVTKEDARESLLSLVKRMGGVDLFFYSAGWGSHNLELDFGIEISTVDLNVKAFTRMIDTIFTYMKENGGGHIVAVSSIAGTKGLGCAASYSATKAFQAVYLQALEQLSFMRGLNIRITDIRPGFVATNLLSDGGKYPMVMSVDKVAKKILKAIKKKRHVQIIDWRYRVLVFLWRLLPSFVWRHLNISAKK